MLLQAARLGGCAGAPIPSTLSMPTRRKRRCVVPPSDGWVSVRLHIGLARDV